MNFRNKLTVAVSCLMFTTTASASAQSKLVDKTLVAWVQPFNLQQRGGSVLTLDNNKSHFDAIVFGEVSPTKWMAGSEGLSRTNSDQASTPEETVQGKEWIQIAIVYKGSDITILRNGEVISTYKSKNPMAEFDDNSIALFGRRHISQGDNAHFAGAIDEARIYDAAMTAKEIAKLKPGVIGDIKPWAYWDFNDSAAEKTGRLPNTLLTPGAMIFNGALLLDGTSGELYSSVKKINAEETTIVSKDIINTVHDFRQKLLADPYRPAYHFSSMEGCAITFDPNGCIWWNGRYHMFYIYQYRGAHVFGHVSSTDMVNWRHHPKALFPTPDSPEDGIFSGNAFITKNGEVAMLYHGTGTGNCIALSKDKNLDTWRKKPGNPIVPIPTPENTPHLDPDTKQPLFASWDPHGWIEGDTYYAIFGGTRAAIFKSKDLDNWEYVGDLLAHTTGGIDLREDISCPDLFKIGDKYALVCISHRLGCRYYVGEWKNEQFYPETHAMMSWADNEYFAPESMLTPDGRRVMWAWVFDGRDNGTIQASGWSGTMSLPRELYLLPNNMLGMRPIAELHNQRYNEKDLGAMSVSSEKVVDAEAGNVIEIMAEIDPSKAGKSGITILRSKDGSEQTKVYYDAVNKQLVIDATKSTVGSMGRRNVEAAPFELEPGETLSLNIFVDKSIVEVYANERQAVSRMVYPEKADSRGISVFSEGGAANVKNLKIWQIMPTNEY